MLWEHDKEDEFYVYVKEMLSTFIYIAFDIPLIRENDAAFHNSLLIYSIC